MVSLSCENIGNLFNSVGVYSICVMKNLISTKRYCNWEAVFPEYVILLS